MSAKLIIEKVGPSRFFRSRKTTQLRSKTASSSTALKVEVLLKGEKRLNFAPKQPLRFSTALFSYYFAVTSRYFAVIRGHNVVATQSLWLLRGLYAVRLLCGHYAVRKSTYSRLRKRSTSLQNGLFDQNIVAVLISLLLRKGFIIPQIGFKFDSIKRKKVSICFMFAATMFKDRSQTGRFPE